MTTITGTALNDQISDPGEDDDVVFGLEGNDIFFDLGGTTDVLDNDTFDGGAGFDIYQTLMGGDVITLADTAAGTLFSSSNGTSATLINVEVAVIISLNTNAVMTIDASATSMKTVLVNISPLGGTIIGGLNGDTIGGGFGQDVMTGNGGGDVFEYQNGLNNAANDYITDFTGLDSLLFAHQGPINFVTQITASGEAQILAVQSTSSTVLEFDVDGDGFLDFTMSLEGVHDLVVGSSGVLTGRPDFSYITLVATEAGGTQMGTGAGEQIDGTGGADIINTFGGDDLIFGGAGDDRLNGGQGNDEINGNDGDDRIFGGDGDDVIYADAGDDIVSAGAGDDMVVNTYGSDIFDLGAGNDTGVGGFSGSSVMYGRAGNDNLSGGSGEDRLYGGTGDDVLYGGAGDDVLNGSAGADTMFGDEGDDKLFVDDLDTLNGGEGYDRIFVQGYSGDITVDMTAGAIEFASGNIANDTFDATGATFSVKMFGRRGDDMLVGGDMADQLFGGLGNDVLIGGAGNDILKAEAGADQIDGGAGDDVMFIDDADTSVIGGEGYDRVYATGSSGGISLDLGVSGVEFASGSNEQDFFNAATSTVAVKIIGRGGKDFLFGGAGDDLIYGGTENDSISGGGGNDLLSGGSGQDVFIFGPGGGADKITDFENGLDIIDLTAFNTAFEDLVISSVGANSSMVEVGGITILLSGVDASDLDASDFTFDGTPLV